MADFNVRSDSVNVEQIMEQIRARIREKRGVDYTEQQIRELAAVKLEKFIDPSGVRSDLLDQFRSRRAAYEAPELPNFAFEESTLFDSHRGIIRFIRKLLKPLMKLFFNPNPLIQALNVQSRLNTITAEHNARVQAARSATEDLLYEVVHNLVVELTRTGIEVKNLKMRVESLASRVEFNERRARALESVVVYKPTNDDYARPPQQQPSSHHQQPSAAPQQASHAPAVAQAMPAQQAQSASPAEGPGQRSRRRRRRRGRRGGAPAAAMMGTPGGVPSQQPAPENNTPVNQEPEHDEPAADDPNPPVDDPQ